MVVTVHDGPWDRAYWSFNRETQFLANRGYAVLDVNFRGSGGYGKDFIRAGIGEFAGAMHSDILDAVSWGIAESSDAALVDEVGLALLLRCEAIRRVTERCCPDPSMESTLASLCQGEGRGRRPTRLSGLMLE
jgi:hypothetical protein